MAVAVIFISEQTRCKRKKPPRGGEFSRYSHGRATAHGKSHQLRFERCPGGTPSPYPHFVCSKTYFNAPDGTRGENGERAGPVAWHVYALAWLGIPLLFVLDFVRKTAIARWHER